MFHTPAHKQPSLLVALRALHQSPNLRSVINESTFACWKKIEQVTAATGATAQIATGYLQADGWNVDDAIASLMSDRRNPVIDEIVGDIAFKVETLQQVFVVRVYYTVAPGGPMAPYPEQQEFINANEARRWAVNRAKWEATIGVVCDELAFRIEGDFVGVSIDDALYAQVPQLKRH